MDRYLVAEAAEILGISKEAVYNRIRRNTLQSVTEDGIKYVLIDTKKAKEEKSKKPQRNYRQSSSNNKYAELLLEQNKELKEKIKELEADKDKLIKEKEKLLIDARKDLEKMHSQKDKQLKQIVSMVSRPLLTYMKNQNEAIDADFEELTPYERGLVFKQEVEKWINLENYMQSKGYSYKKKKQINTQVVAKVGISKNIKEENGILFIKRGAKIKQILKEKS